jgi:tRNA(Arg) A34 adenosine deaminase TadA
MHDPFMREALAQADEARRHGEVPVGAVVVMGGEVVGRGFNQPISTHNATAHAEIVAIADAGGRRGNYRLTGATLYVTVEPCLMCVGAIIHARIDTVVFGTTEPKAGAIESTQRAHEHAALNHRVTVVSGVLAAECRALLQSFFAERRASR